MTTTHLMIDHVQKRLNDLRGWHNAPRPRHRRAYRRLCAIQCYLMQRLSRGDLPRRV